MKQAKWLFLLMTILALSIIFFSNKEPLFKNKLTQEEKFFQKLTESEINEQEFKENIINIYSKHGTLDPYTYHSEFYKESGKEIMIYSKFNDVEVFQKIMPDEELLIYQNDNNAYIMKNNKSPITISKDIIEENNLIDDQNAEEMYNIFSNKEFVEDLVLIGEISEVNKELVFKYVSYEITTYFIFDAERYYLKEIVVFDALGTLTAQTRIEYKQFDLEMSYLREGEKIVNKSEVYEYLTK